MFGNKPITPKLGSSPSSSLVRIKGRTFDLPPLSPLASLQDIQTQLSVRTIENISLISRHANHKIQSVRTQGMHSQSMYSIGSPSQSIGSPQQSIGYADLSIGSNSPSIYMDPSTEDSTALSATNPVHLVGPCFEETVVLKKRIEAFNIPAMRHRPTVPFTRRDVDKKGRSNILSDLRTETDRIMRECRICASFRPLTEAGGALEKAIRRAM
jgi:hypothetical protein